MAQSRDRLLKVLIYPELPLHNNGSEIALLDGVIKRNISYGTRSEADKVAWENQWFLAVLSGFGVRFNNIIS